MTEVEQAPTQNGEIGIDEDEHNKSRPADIEQDMREMERRKRVEAIMNSKLFREELERIVDNQMREGGAAGILQQLSDIVGVPASRVGSVFKSSNCVLPINDIRGVESMGYSKGEKILRCKLAATFRLLDLYGWSQGLSAQITARLQADQELFLVNPFGLLFHEVTASSLNKVDMQGNIVEQGTTNFGINLNQYILHSVVHAARPDIRCVIYIGCNAVVSVSSLKAGVIPLTKDSAVLGEIATHSYTGSVNEPEEREKLIRNLGPISKVLLLTNHGALCCGETIEEAFYLTYHIVQACETQLKLLPVGLDNLVLMPEETRKQIYDASRKPPEGLEQQKPITTTSGDGGGETSQQADNKESGGKDVKDGVVFKEKLLHQKPKWRVGGAEFEALMRMLDNAGFRTGYIYRHPLVKSELPKPKNDVEVPPAVSSLGYLLEEEELYRQGVWKKSDLRKGGDRTRWLNSPNVYQKIEVLETGTPDPKKITKWVADGSPTHSTPVKIDSALQFVPKGTNPREFKSLQQLIKDNRRADKISAGPQSHILEGVTWDEANRIRDATVSATGDHVVLVGAASKGIIQRGYQHNATVYKTPYAKNPFDSVTDDELNEYKKTIERKQHGGEYTDTDFSESEALSSLQTSGAQQKILTKNIQSQSETEDASEPQVMRIETKQAPKPSQPEVVLSDANTDFLNMERTHVTITKKPPTGRASKRLNKKITDQEVVDIQDNSNNKNHNHVAKTNNITSLHFSRKQIIQIDNENPNQINIDNNMENINQQQENSEKYVNKLKKMHDNDNNFSQNPPLLKINLVSDNEKSSSDTIESDSSSSSIPSYVSFDLFEKFRNPHIKSNSMNTIGTDKTISTDIRALRNSAPSKLVFISDASSYVDVNNLQYSEISIDILDYDEPYYYTVTPPAISSGGICRKRKLFDSPDPRKKSPSNLLPYRTVSHFGFNCPKFIQPDHKHIPKLPSKYKPIRRSKSYEEIFGNMNNIVDDDCFNEILKRKACEKVVENSKSKAYSIEVPTVKEDQYSADNNDKNYYVDYEDYDYIDNYKPSAQWFKSMLNPISEDEDEDQITEIPTIATTLPTFVKEIAKLTFSSESPNLDYKPETFELEGNNFESVEITIDNLLADEINESKSIDETMMSFGENSPSKKRKLMSREERLQRKEEFHDLWEDHISYYSSTDKEQFSDSSDNETNENNCVEKSSNENSDCEDVFISARDESNLSGTRAPNNTPQDIVSIDLQLNFKLDISSITTNQMHEKNSEVNNNCSTPTTLSDNIVDSCSTNDNQDDYISAKSENTNPDKITIDETISETVSKMKTADTKEPNTQEVSENFNEEFYSISKDIISAFTSDNNLENECKLNSNDLSQSSVTNDNEFVDQSEEISTNSTEDKTLNRFMEDFNKDSEELNSFDSDNLKYAIPINSESNPNENLDSLIVLMNNQLYIQLDEDFALENVTQKPDNVTTNKSRPDILPEISPPLSAKKEKQQFEKEEKQPVKKEEESPEIIINDDDDYNCCTDKENSFNANLNSTEKLILEKIEKSDLDRTKGTIYHKIENAIRNKLTPIQLQQKINEEYSKISNEIQSLTPRKITLNSCNVTTPLKMKQINNEEYLKTNEIVSSTPESINNLTENSNCSNLYSLDVSNFSPIKSSLSNTFTLTEKNETKSNTKIHKNIISKQSKSIKRNFITENIKNVSRNARIATGRNNFRAVFGLNPFDNKPSSPIINSSKSNLSNQSNKSTNLHHSKCIPSTSSSSSPRKSVAIYSFQTGHSNHGSPKFWVTIAPSSSSKRKLKSIITEKQRKIKLQNTSSTHSKNSIDLQEIPPCHNDQVENQLKKLDKATQKLSKVMKRYDNKCDEYDEQIHNINSDINQIVELQENIEETRRQIRENLLDQHQENHKNSLDNSLTVSINENDD